MDDFWFSKWPTVISNSLFHFEIIRVNQDFIFLVCGQWILWVCLIFIFEKSRYFFRRLNHKKLARIARNCGRFHTLKMLKIRVKIITNFSIYYILFYILTVSQSGYFPNVILNNRSVLYWVIGLKQFQFFCICKCFFVS